MFGSVIMGCRAPWVKIEATDLCLRAVACARENATTLNLPICVHGCDLFPLATNDRPDVIVCNPPWIPTASSAPEQGVFDHNDLSERFLSGVGKYLSHSGEAWFIMSNLAELFGLRDPHFWDRSFALNGLRIVDRCDAFPSPVRSGGTRLEALRAREVVSLYRLCKAFS